MRFKLASILVAGVAVAALGGVAATASAGGNTLRVTQNVAGQVTVVEGTTLQAGPAVKANFTSDYSNARLEIFQLRNGVTLLQLDAKAAEAELGGSVAAAATQWLTQNVTFYGGGQVKFDRIMPVGTYWVAQLRPSGSVKPSNTAKQVKVVGTPQATQPYADQKLTVVNTNGPDRFSINVVSGPVHSGAITIVNKTGSITNPTRELHRFKWTQVKDDATTAKVTAWLTGTGPSQVYEDGDVFDFGTLSTQGVAHVYLDVTPGKYVVLSEWADANSGIKHDREGEFLLVDVA